MTGVSRSWQQGGSAANERGIAMLTVMLIMLMMTVLGFGALTVTGLENRMAGFATSIEGAVAAAESCTGVGVNVIQQTIDPYVGAGTLPTTFLSNAMPPGPVPQSNSLILNQEIMGQLDNNADIAYGSGSAPNLSLTVGAFEVYGDIDRLYVKGRSGSSMQHHGAYEGPGSSAVGSTEIFYRVDCVARNAATGTTARVTAVYSCTLTGESCQK